MASRDDEDQRSNEQIVHCALFQCFGIILVAVPVAALYFLGPTDLFSRLLKFLPENPGWNWFFGWELFLFLMTLLALPVWPAACVASGLMFGQQLSC